MKQYFFGIKWGSHQKKSPPVKAGDIFCLCLVIYNFYFLPENDLIF